MGRDAVSPVLAEVRQNMAPGAEVREQPDGSVSVKGFLHAAARAEMARAHQLVGQ
jgi:hypothetical protein